MTLQQTLSVLTFLAGLAGLWALCILWRNYRLDAFRQTLFAVRDELFDAAARGEIEFNDPAYWRLRVLINMMIRHANRMNLSGGVIPVIVVGSLLGDDTTGVVEEWFAAVREHPQDVQEKLVGLHNCVMEALGKQVFSVSPIAVPALVVWYTVPAFKAAMTERFKRLEDEIARDDQMLAAA